MKPRSSPFFLVAIFSVIQFVPGYSEEDIVVTRSIEPAVLQRLESQFLKRFGMEKRPTRFKSSIKVPHYLADLYKVQTGLDLPTSNLHLPGRHTRTANTVRTFYPTSPSSLIFDLSSIPPREEVTGAEIRIPINRTQLIQTFTSSSVTRTLANLKVRVIINDVVKTKGDEPFMYPVDSKFINLMKRPSDVFALTLDVFPAVSRWIVSKQKMNRGLKIQVFEATENTEIDWTWDPTNYSESPTLFTYSDDGAHNRRARDAKTLSRHYRSAVQERRSRKQHRKKNRKRNLCSKRKMFVDFTEVGWNDWIVAPPGYEAYFCSGECPFPMADHLNATNHAVIQALVNSMNPQQVPPPCCVPTKYSGLSLLYNDASDKVVLKNYEDMAVEACGCS